MPRFTFQDAKQIPIEQMAYSLGGVFDRQKGHEIWIKPPWRPEEKTASCKLDTRHNRFMDFGPGSQGEGDIIDLYCDAKGKHRRDRQAIQDGLKHAESLTRNTPVERRPQALKNELRQPSETFRLLGQPQRISDKTENLMAEIARRGIPAGVVRLYLQQGYILNTKTKQKFYAFIQENLSGGYEISNFNPEKEKSFKNCIGTKDIDVFGPSPSNKEKRQVFVFNGRWDRITWLHHFGRQKNGLYINTNSDRLVVRAAEYILQRPDPIAQVLYFKDHDDLENAEVDAKKMEDIGKADRAESDFFVTLENGGLKASFGCMDWLYPESKDLSDAHMKKRAALATRMEGMKRKGLVMDPGDTAWRMVQNRPQGPAPY